MAAFFVLLQLLLSISRADPPAEVRPDLYLDGEALANRMTAHVLKHTYPGAGLRREAVFGLRSSLHKGRPFRMDDPSRAALREWMLRQPDGSIEPHEFLAKAIELSNQSVQQALMLSWDVLRENYLDAENRNAFDHILKLRDITGERELFDGLAHPWPMAEGKAPKSTQPEPTLLREAPEKLKAIRGDNFSAWYHLVGTALSAFHRTASRFYPISGRAETDFMIFMEENVLYDDHIDSRKRIAIDRAGAQFGDRLARNLKAYATPSQFERSPAARRTDYLYDRPDLYGESWRLREGQHPRDYGTDRRTKFQDGLAARLRKARGLAENFTLEAAREALLDDHPYVRDHAVQLLGDRTDAASRALLESIVRATPREPQVAAAVRALARRRDPAAGRLFAQLGLGSEDAVIRGAANEALDELPDTPETRVRLPEIWGRTDAAGRRRLVLALEKFDPDWRSDALAIALRSDEAEVRGEAIGVLGRAKDPASLRIAQAFLQATRPPELPWARAWAAYFGGPKNPDWQALSRYNQTKLRLAQNLEQRGDPGALAVLAALAGDPDSRLRQAAVRAGGATAPSSGSCLRGVHAELLRTNAQDPTRETRVTAILVPPAVLISGVLLTGLYLSIQKADEVGKRRLDSPHAPDAFAWSWKSVWDELRHAGESEFNRRLAVWARARGIQEGDPAWGLRKGALSHPTDLSQNQKLSEAYIAEDFGRTAAAHPDWTVRQWRETAVQGIRNGRSAR